MSGQGQSTTQIAGPPGPGSSEIDDIPRVAAERESVGRQAGSKGGTNTPHLHVEGSCAGGGGECDSPRGKECGKASSGRRPACATALPAPQRASCARAAHRISPPPAADWSTSQQQRLNCPAIFPRSKQKTNQHTISTPHYTERLRARQSKRRNLHADDQMNNPSLK
jgi:hypothetical protein